MSQSVEWALVLVTLLVAVTALLVPMVSEWLKRKTFAPKLQVRYEHDSPYCVRTELRSHVDPSTPVEPVYSVSFGVVNEGRSRAENCEAILEELHVYDVFWKAPKAVQFLRRKSVLGLGGGAFLNINPKRKVLCKIGHIASLSYQVREEQRIAWTSQVTQVMIYGSNWIRYSILSPNPTAWLRVSIPFKIVVYSENAPTVAQHFEVAWTGKWQDSEREMRRELVVERMNRA